MSADNGIYVLRTLKPSTLDVDGNAHANYEYRVRHLQAVENVDWDETKKNPDVDYVGDYTDNDDVRIRNAREMWKDCQVFTDYAEATKEAQRQYDEVMNDDFCPIVEYGICNVVIDREF